MTCRSAPACVAACLTLFAAVTPLRAQRDLIELRERAEQGDPTAQFNLARQYLTGSGVPRDDQEAVRWYRLAAEQDHAGAQHSLGVRYDTGSGVSEDDAEAARWYRLAA
ncbi:MAG TPA: hypothetical protein DEQ98_15735, partial [Acidobacteria bacterium]|nr:hypothetical protein [Acidobacteriota bacterium]